MTPEEATAKAAMMIIDQMSPEMRAEVLADDEKLLMIIDFIRSESAKLHEAAKLNDMSFEEFAQAFRCGLGEQNRSDFALSSTSRPPRH